MNKNIWVVAGAFAVVAAISIVWAYVRSSGMASDADIAKRGLAVIKRENIILFGLVIPAVMALASYFTYHHWFLG